MSVHQDETGNPFWQGGVMLHQRSDGPIGAKVKVETPGFSDGWVEDGQVHDLWQLVRWLARPYGDNLPIFAEAEGQPERARLLSDLYKRVVGKSDFQLPAQIEWWRCPECDTWQTRALEVIDV